MHRTEDQWPVRQRSRGNWVHGPSLLLAGCVTLGSLLPRSGHLSCFLLPTTLPWVVVVSKGSPCLTGQPRWSPPRSEWAAEGPADIILIITIMPQLLRAPGLFYVVDSVN